MPTSNQQGIQQGYRQGSQGHNALVNLFEEKKIAEEDYPAQFFREHASTFSQFGSLSKFRGAFNRIRPVYFEPWGASSKY